MLNDDSDNLLSQNPIDNGSSQPVGAAPALNWTQNMNPLEWQFLNEPAWKWAVFFVLVTCFGVAWNGVLRHMK